MRTAQTRLELAAARQSIATLTAALSAADRRHAEVSNALESARADAETSKQVCVTNWTFWFSVRQQFVVKMLSENLACGSQSSMSHNSSFSFY